MPSHKANTAQAPLSALGDDGKSVDWWFIYKVPKGAASAKSGKAASQATGFEYAYFDDRSQTLAASKHQLEDPASALELTLGAFLSGSSASVGYVFYNDEYPASVGKPDDGGRGHCKGVLAFDTGSDTAIWLLHSTPKYPDPTKPAFPATEVDYGQTFLCITLKDVATAEAIATQMLSQQGPQVYGARLPASLPQDSVWHKLASSQFTLTTQPSDVPFQSKAGARFLSLAKSSKWGQDLWSDLVGPKLGTNLDVECWKRGQNAGTADNDHLHTVADVTAIDLSSLGMPYAWPESKDHAKWAVSLKGGGNWVCVADINRMVSQGKRGGGAICFQHDKLWSCLSGIDQVVPAKQKA